MPKKQTPKQRRQATARMLDKLDPDNPKVKKGSSVMVDRNMINRIKRDLRK